MLPLPALQKVLSASATILAPNITHLFGPSLSSGAAIYLASEPNYASHVSQRWTTHEAPSFIATIQPATIEDVENTVSKPEFLLTHYRRIKEFIPFLATGGGHGVSVQMAELQGGIQIDLRKFNHVDFDSETQRVTVGGSTIFSQLIGPLSASGAQFPLGTAYCVGIVGATLGAGVSANQGYAGLLSDLLEEVQLVTAAGKSVTSSRTENRDLFWAIRGAGANFGIVTSATYKVPPPINGGNVTNANFFFPESKALDVFKYIESLDDTMSERLAFNIAIVFDRKVGEVSLNEIDEYHVWPGNSSSLQVVLLVNVNFFGSVNSATRHLKPLFRLRPLRSEVLNVHWPAVFRTSYFGIEDTKACSRNQHVNMRSIGARSTNPKAWLKFLRELKSFSGAHPDIGASMVIHRFATQRVLRVTDEDSAYPHRQLKMHIQLETEYDDRRHEGIVDAFLNAARDDLTATSGFDTPAVYVNFAHGDEGPEAWYGARNLRKLTRMKQKWDPKGLFNFYNSLRPTEISDAELSEIK
ncbi:hypothetical protein NUW58_g297 [Xylaria curta]|uniref:Uncharacterized protein n=2 Tax=Xylaria curta TaxID=42375 RepID=A0ACC1PQW1_9PEZI|nr:hypothetical protein NUW58_g8191 [Xylaria curta]KAJ2998460.1 hypothetical protein NUW58_g297 [Xylaria curta]